MAVLNSISEQAKKAGTAIARRFGKKDAKRQSPSAYRRGEIGTAKIGLTEPGTTHFPRPIGKNVLSRRKAKKAKKARKLAALRVRQNKRFNSAARH